MEALLRIQPVLRNSLRSYSDHLDFFCFLVFMGFGTADHMAGSSSTRKVPACVKDGARKRILR